MKTPIFKRSAEFIPQNHRHGDSGSTSPKLLWQQMSNVPAPSFSFLRLVRFFAAKSPTGTDWPRKGAKFAKSEEFRGTTNPAYLGQNGTIATEKP